MVSALLSVSEVRVAVTKARLPIVVSALLGGIVSEVRILPLKACSPIVVSALLSVSEVRRALKKAR